jgi:hypothetical protein
LIDIYPDKDNEEKRKERGKKKIFSGHKVVFSFNYTQRFSSSISFSFT